MKTKISLRGRQFVGTIVSAKAQKTVTVSWGRLHYIPKYERYEKRRTKIQAHVKEGLKLKVGDKVRLVETRPISKTKHFMVVGVVK
jgi:small subunit ribosomal protein S17